MNPLRPYPFGALLRRVFTELQTRDSVFDLPRKKFHAGFDDLDLSVDFHGHRAGTPYGPAAGPHSQLAQNIVLAYLGGARIMELKTVQILDTLDIPRPCIDMATVGYNIEWSQELTLEESLEEYVKASMTLEIMQAAGLLDGVADTAPIHFDMSVGYDLKGIRSPRVQAFINGMMDAEAVIERLRGQIPAAYAAYRDLPFKRCISDTLTLSTFHGCPPDEIERIIEHLLEHNGLHCIIKLNPTLLGPERLRSLLHDTLGYTDIQVPDTAFEQDATWDQAMGIVDRLQRKASGLGLGLGVKFSNTLIVHNHRDFFPASEKSMYLSGQPLHVLAMNLVGQFRAHWGDQLPVSFSAGIDKTNFADAVGIGLVPVTVCSDLLKAGGYGRAQGYMKALAKRMRATQSPTIECYIIRAFGLGEEALQDLELDADTHSACLAALPPGGDLRIAAGEHFEAWVSAARVRNTAHYVPLATANPHYSQAKNAKPPKKVGTTLELFDCLTCNKCLPVCPNAANFSLHAESNVLPSVKLQRDGERWTTAQSDTIELKKKHQIGNFADFCNDCGNCDVFCPEDGGPYLIKPRFFSRERDFEQRTLENGFFFPGPGLVRARIDGKDYTMVIHGEQVGYTGPDFSVKFSLGDPAGTLIGNAGQSIDLTPFEIMRWYQHSALDSGYVNDLTSLR
jgi:putative selenate reductase